MTGREKQAELVQDQRTEYVSIEKDWNLFASSLTESERAFVREYIEFTRYRRLKAGRRDK